MSETGSEWMKTPPVVQLPQLNKYIRHLTTGVFRGGETKAEIYTAGGREK